MKFNRLGAFTLGVVITAASVGAVSFVNAAGNTTLKACANKKTGAMRYIEKGKCKTTETSLSWNQMGPQGLPGTAGTNGVAGAKGEAGTAGTNGVAGAKGEAGTAGTNGTNATLAITQLSVCDGTDADTVANEVCKVGMTGPGGGLIFFVDYNDEYAGLNYLEAAPVGWGNGIQVNQGSLTGETTGTTTVDPLMKWCSNTSSLLGLDAWSNSAVGVGGSNTSTADTTCAGGAIQAVSDYAGGTKTDWFLPSIGEAMLMYTNLRQVGASGFTSEAYWSSSESIASIAWAQLFMNGTQNYYLQKSYVNYVRPVRAF